MSVTASRPQFAAAHALARAFGHWWADVARLPICGARPAVRFAPDSVSDGMDEAAAQVQEDADRAAYSMWASACNAVTGEEVAARFSGQTWEAIGEACQKADTDPDSWGGVLPAPSHTTGSGTLAWDIAWDGAVTFTARRRGSRAHPAIWWTATVAPGGTHTITAHEGAPSGPGDDWEEDHSGESPQRGEYTWQILRGAIILLGGDPPALPPLKPRQFAPPRGGSRRSMAAIA